MCEQALPGGLHTAWRALAGGMATVCLVALILSLAQALPAFAHASLVRAEPADGAVVAEPPASLKLTFNEPVSPLVMRIIGPDGEVIAPADVAVENTIVTITPPRLRQGTHVLSWRVISTDGHPIGGSVLFAVGAPSAGAAAAPGLDTDPAVKVAIWAAKLALYIGLFIGIGGVAFIALIAQPRPLPPRAETWIAAAMVFGLIAAVLSAGLQGLDAMALPLTQAWRPQVWTTGLGTTYGATAVIAAVALMLGLAAPRAPSPLMKPLAFAALGGVGLALAVSGHAGTAGPWFVSRPAVFLHGVCVAFWIGALLPLIVLVRGAPAGDRSLARFSRAIPFALGALAATGLLLAFLQLDRFDALWTTDYGSVLFRKLVFVAVLLALAAANRYWLVPRFERLGSASARPLAASIAAEFAIALVILGLVALWRFTPPPRALAATESIAFHIHDPKAMINAALAPRRGQGAELSILVWDAELRPLAVKEVTLVLAYPAAGIEPVRRVATDVGEGNWRIDDLRIPLAGRWDVRIDILINDFEKVVLEEKVELPRAP
jgi:copper transport protein